VQEFYRTTIKDYIDRARPDVVTQLVEVSGLSYPSGRSMAATSLYLTVAIVVSRHLQRTGNQIAILAMTVGIVLLVGMKGIYLGMHYQAKSPVAYRVGRPGRFCWPGAFRSSLIPRSPAAGNSPLDRALPVLL
jgi:PAP2 superfamily